MKFFYSPYQLQPQDKSAPRSGALLKVVWNERKIGYADLHPWPELGDEPLAVQIEKLKQLKLTNLTEQCVWLASIDAKGRMEKRNLYDNQILLKNNAIITKLDNHTVELLDPVAKNGFSKVKIKVGVDPDEEIKLINRIAQTHTIKLRLDFNNRLLSYAAFEKFINALSVSAKFQIDYVEDPFPYNEEAWKKARELAPLAIDWGLEKIDLRQDQHPQADVLIIKPMRDDVDKRMAQALKWNMKATVTSHMGHPLGVMQCAQVAQDLHVKHPNVMLDPGCLTFDIYQPTEFHFHLNLQGPYIRKVAGWGIGFDVLLKGQKWLPL